MYFRNSLNCRINISAVAFPKSADGIQNIRLPRHILACPRKTDNNIPASGIVAVVQIEQYWGDGGLEYLSDEGIRFGKGAKFPHEQFFGFRQRAQLEGGFKNYPDYSLASNKQLAKVKPRHIFHDLASRAYHPPIRQHHGDADTLFPNGSVAVAARTA